MADRVIPQAAGQSFRQQEIAPGEYAPEVYTVNAVSAAVAQQRFFIAGSGRLTLGLAGNVRGLLSNPSGSGRKVLVVRLAFFASSTGYATAVLNPTTGLPSGSRAPFNAVLGSAVSPVATLATDTSTTTPLAGGTATSLVVGIPSNGRESIDLPPLVLSPGASLGLNIPFSAAADATFSVYWIEEDV